MTPEERLPGSGSERLLPRTVGWWAVGLVLLTVLAWVGSRYLGWLVLGLFTYYLGRPIARRLERRLAPSLAAGLTLTFIVVPIMMFIAAFLGVALGQALTILSSDAVESVVDRLPLPTTGLPTDPVDVVVVLLQDPTITSALGQFGVAVGALTATLFNLFLTLLFAFFLLIEDGRIAQWFETNVAGTDSTAVDYLKGMDRGLTSVYFGYALTIFVVILLAGVVYTVFNLIAPSGLTIPSAMLLAVVTGVFTLIPLVGRSIVYALIVALLSVEALAVDPSLLWVPALFFVLMVVVFDNVVRTYIRPYLSGKTYHMGLVMFAYLLGPALFGWYGIFLGPLLMVVVYEFLVRVLPLLTGVDDGIGTAPDPTVEETRTEGVGGSPSRSGEPLETDREDVPTG